MNAITRLCEKNTLARLSINNQVNRQCINEKRTNYTEYNTCTIYKINNLNKLMTRHMESKNTKMEKHTLK